MTETLIGVTKVSTNSGGNLEIRPPKAAREALGVTKGDQVAWFLEDGKVYAVKNTEVRML